MGNEKNVRDLKILYVSHDSLNTGAGVSTYIKNLMNYFKNSQNVSFRNKENSSLAPGEYNINAMNKFNEIIYFSPKKLKIFIKRINNADIIHDNPFSFSHLIFLLLYKMFGKKVISTLHSNIEFQGANFKKYLEIYRYVIIVNFYSLFTNKIIFVTNAQKKIIRKFILFKRLFDKKSIVIHNFIESSQILNNTKSSRKLTILYVGRLTKYKGFGDLLKLIELLKGKDIQFNIVGEGELRSLIPNYKNVKYMGSLSHERLLQTYKNSTILISPSYSETFGLVILEAMAKGLVILTSDLPAIREYFIEKRNGYFFKAGAVKEMESLILDLKNNSYKIKKISSNNLKDSHKFNEDKQIPKYKELYISLIK